MKDHRLDAPLAGAEAGPDWAPGLAGFFSGVMTGLFGDIGDIGVGAEAGVSPDWVPCFAGCLGAVDAALAGTGAEAAAACAKADAGTAIKPNPPSAAKPQAADAARSHDLEMRVIRNSCEGQLLSKRRSQTAAAFNRAARWAVRTRVSPGHRINHERVPRDALARRTSTYSGVAAAP